MGQQVKIISILLTSFLLTSICVAQIPPTPITPQVFYGSVTLSGIPALDGIPVYACIGEILKGNTTTNGDYTMVVSGLESTDIINFYVCSLQAGSYNSFASGEITQWDLTAFGTCTDELPCSVEEPDTPQINGNNGGSGGGGSLGGSASIITPPINKSTILDEICYIFNLSQGKKVISINKSELAFTEISFNVQGNISNAKINISLLEKLPSYISSLNNVYKYLLIETNLKSEDIKNVTITFKISKSWLNQNNLNKTDAVLARFYDGWSSLDTKLVSEDNSFIYYKSETPYFSIVAISVREHIENPLPEFIELPKENETKADDEVGGTPSFGTNFYLIVGGIITIVLVVIILILLNKKQRNKEVNRTYKYKKVNK